MQDQWAEWVGRQETLGEDIGTYPARALAATLNRETGISCEPGAPLPPLWTWLYFLPLAPMAQVGPDGHPKRGGFLPPIEHPRRMWAGSRCRFHAPICIGDRATKTSTIQKVAAKTGKTGPMVFVTVEHEIWANNELAMTEEQDIVYMNIPDVFNPPAPVQLPECDWHEAATIDPVVLFRFSALTFNGHRIHYDRSYAMDVEKYPGLVVHGPLQAILLFDAACRHVPDRTPTEFDFRGMRPLFDFDAVTLNGQVQQDDTLDLLTANGDDAIGMKATMKWAAQ